ncbi:hypothetical protein FKM82_024644 [Ascaphus truei]
MSHATSSGKQPAASQHRRLSSVKSLHMTNGAQLIQYRLYQPKNVLYSIPKNQPSSSQIHQAGLSHQLHCKHRHHKDTELCCHPADLRKTAK